MPFLRQNYSFGYFRHVRIYLLGMVVSIQRYLRGLSASKKSSTLTLRDCSIAILGALGMPWQISTQSYIAKLSTILVLLFIHAKIVTIHQVFFQKEAFEEFCYLTGYLGMHDHAHQKQRYQLAENMKVYLYTKNQLLSLLKMQVVSTYKKI